MNKILALVESIIDL